jgi:predicted  nucleic acid-binding Zn-ribbon protein
MLKKIKSVLAVVGGALLAILGYLLISKERPQTGAKDELKEAQKKVEEAKEKITSAEQAIKDAQKKTDEEVEHAKEIKVSSDPDAVADALNDVLARARRGQSGGQGQQNCDGCAGRH